MLLSAVFYLTTLSGKRKFWVHGVAKIPKKTVRVDGLVYSKNGLTPDIKGRAPRFLDFNNLFVTKQYTSLDALIESKQAKTKKRGKRNE